MMKKLRAIYEPDKETPDWPIYFYPKFINESDYYWVMDKDDRFRYPFWVPFEDDEWYLEKMIDNEWVSVNL